MPMTSAHERRRILSIGSPHHRASLRRGITWPIQVWVMKNSPFVVIFNQRLLGSPEAHSSGMRRKNHCFDGPGMARMWPILVAMLGLMSSMPAWPSWVEVLRTPASTFYMDPESSFRDGQTRRTWVVENYSLEPDNEIMSTRYLYECDCTRHRLRITATSQHTQLFGRGRDIANSSVNGVWRPTDQNAIDRKICLSVCGRP